MAPKDQTLPNLEDWLTHGAGGAVVKLVAQEAAKGAVAETFATLGVDLRDPASIREFRDGISHASAAKKAQRDRSESIRRGMIHALYSIGVAGLIGIVTLLSAFLKTGIAAK